MEIDEHGMVTFNAEELARKMTSFYDALLLPSIRLEQEGKLTKGEIELLLATHRRWDEMLELLFPNCFEYAPSHPLRGEGEWAVATGSVGQDKEFFEAMK